MKEEIIRQYSLTARFLAGTLGPDYEVVLCDLENAAVPRIVAIEGGRIGGRVWRTEPGLIERQLIAGIDPAKDWKINYSIAAEDGSRLRCSTLYIKDADGRVTGMLSVNFDDSRYRELSEKVFGLCHPDAFAERNIAVSSAPPAIADTSGAEEMLFGSIDAALDAAVAHVTGQPGISPARLSTEEKMAIADVLDRRGIFALKGAVKAAAARLGSSQASIYRYIAAARAERRDPDGNSSDRG